MKRAVLVDSHAHLDGDLFSGDLSEVIDRAEKSGIAVIISVGIDEKTSYRCIELTKQHRGLYASCGLHPNSAEQWTDELESRFALMGDDPKVVAIGETGLDYYWDACPKDQQLKVLKCHLELAKRKCLPVIIHCREAHADLMGVCREYQKRWGSINGVIHCFSGGPTEARNYVEMGFYISFAGPLTYKKSQCIREAIGQVPLDRILVETDAPYLPPQAFRGKRNEPSYLVETAQCAAGLLGISVESFGLEVTSNARRLFGIPEG